MSAKGPLSGKVIAITGASSGIGRETAKLLARRGASLSMADIQGQGLRELTSELQSQYGTQVLDMVVDVRDARAVDDWIAATVSRFGRLDGAANMAGVVPRSLGLQDVTQQDGDEWNFVLAVNLTGLMHCLRAQLRHMADHGSVVTASSIAGTTGRRKNSSYTASKHGILGLTRSAAKDFGHRGIRVNAICPGRIITPLSIAAEERLGVRARPGSSAYPDIALRRDGLPDEVAKVVAFLLSDESSYISGADISIDGGWRC